jgi:hypothetical protein
MAFVPVLLMGFARVFVMAFVSLLLVGFSRVFVMVAAMGLVLGFSSGQHTQREKQPRSTL